MNQIISHPSMPKIYNDDKLSLAYILSSLSLNDFFAYLPGIENQKALDDILFRLDRQSPLACYFARSGDNIYFNLYNEDVNSEILISAEGKTSYRPGFDEISESAIYYLLYRLINDHVCPWHFKELQKNWPITSTVAKTLLNYQKQKNPIALTGLILRTNQYDEDQLIKLGHSLNNLNYLKQTKTLALKIDSFRSKTLLVASKQQEHLFYCIEHGTSRKNFWWDRNHDHRKQSAWNHIQFIFSDNITFAVKDLLNHPYAVLLPPHLIPKNLSKNNMLTSFGLWDGANSEITDINKEILSHFISSKEYQAKTLDLYLTTVVPTYNIPYLKIDQIELLDSKINYDWKMTGRRLGGRLNTGEAALAFSKDGKSLILNSFAQQKECFKMLAKQYRLGEVNESTNTISAIIDSKVDIYQLTTEFAKYISRPFNVHLDIDDCTKIPDENITVNIFLEPSESGQYQTGFNIEVKLPNTEESIYNLSGIPQLLYRCINGIHDGLGQFFFEYDNKDLAIQKQGEKRKNDLKLLRHSGIFKLLLAETIRHLNTPIDQQAKIKDFEKNLIQKTLLALCGPHTNNENQISTRVKGYIKEFFHAIYMERNLENYLFSDGSQIYQVNLKKPILRQLESMLEWIIYCYGESSLTKTQIKELTYTNRIYPSQGAFISKRDIAPQVFPLFSPCEISKGILAMMGNKQYDVYISGKKITSLSEELFTTSLSIGDNQGKINWFDLHPKIFFNGKELSFEQVQEMKDKDIMIFEGTPYHVNFNQMPKLKFLDRFWAKLKNTKLIKKESHNNSAIFRQEKSLLLEVLSLRNAGIAINTCDEWIKICDDFDSLMKNKTDDLARHDFKVPLKDYQRTGTQWLLNLHKIGLGGVLADDMGLGKTIQAIGFLDILRLQNSPFFHMIVVPTSLIYNWTSEIKRFAPLLEFEIFESKLKNDYDIRWKTSPPKVIIITYGLLAENSDFLNQFTWNSAIFDEAQNLKNITAQRSSAARSLNSKSSFCITGTPMENHYGEFYSLIDLCVPGSLGEYKDFMRTFAIDGVPSTKLNEEIKFLRTKTSPLVLRRMKADMLEQLPEKTESSILIPFEKQQKEIYRNIAISWNDKIKSVIDEDAQSNTQLQMLTALLRLRQICSFPAMVEKIKYTKTPPKFELLFEAVAEIYEKGESVLIFTNFVTTLTEIEKHFRSLEYKTHTIYGAMTAKKRQTELKDFQESSQASILIMTLKTGGVGLNLTKASYVFHVEPWWNPASENQATDRAHRMGQNKSVQVYRYLMKDSVEEKIQELKSIKGQAFDALFKEVTEDESETDLASHKAFSGQMSYKDFQYLLD